MSATEEIQRGKRFTFGRNWASFLKTLDDSRIQIAMQSLRELLVVEDLSGKTFLDVGSGSGLFSLAARKLGATVHSFDFDPMSVKCAQELRERFDSDSRQWTIEQGSALDAEFLSSLGKFDVVYSWGVLHHTGQMWQALENVSQLVHPGGKLAIAIYNDQGLRSKLWHLVKRVYCANAVGRMLMLAIFIPWFFVRTILVSLIRGRNEFAAYRRNRGMSIVHDWIDWLGGYPFEVATFEEIERFFGARGFRLISSKRTRRLGCNEFCFQQTQR
ncbi:class I SAM-dependent methyltransferase [Planctomicrobium sp. SH661]|uniref:class I SAM-dependent methyltransferase n=1 Tax=Planctomicrobium sp. SH661 TaxID=3448124 RepID=UPI003F5BB4CF